MTTILATLFFLALTARLMRPAGFHGSMWPTTNARRLDEWGRRMSCAEFKPNSEARLCLQARGAVAKRAMLAHLRNRQPMRAPEARLCGLRRIGDGPLSVFHLDVRPLASLQAVPNVTVRRPRLSLAR